MKKLLCLLLLILVFASCRRGLREDITEENGGIYGIPVSFTISTPTGIANIDVEAAAARLTNRFLGYGLHIQVNIESYIWQERAEHFERMLGQFAAGFGPDIFVRDGFLLYRFIENGFIQDIYPLIDMSDILGTYWSRDDFFENVLRGHEISGRLYSMPM